MGARSKRIKQIESTSLGNFIRACEQMESRRDEFRRNWSGGFGLEDSLYIAVPLSTHRDATTREESNWSIIEPAMAAADSFAHVSEHPGVIFHREGSCLNGWIENIYVRRDDAGAIQAAMDFMESLAEYPILNWDDYNERQWEADHPDSKCYSDNPDCPCEVNQHHCTEWFRACIQDAEPPDDAHLMSIDSEDGTWYCAGPGCGKWNDLERVHGNILNNWRIGLIPGQQEIF